jgi:hypothetical protein
MKLAFTFITCLRTKFHLPLDSRLMTRLKSGGPGDRFLARAKDFCPKCTNRLRLLLKGYRNVKLTTWLHLIVEAKNVWSLTCKSVADLNPEVRSSGTAQNVALYRAYRPDLWIRIRHCSNTVHMP